MAAERAAFRALQPTLEAARLVFVDESGLEQGMRSAYGYAPRGQRCAEAAPFRVGRRLGLLGFLGARGGGLMPVMESVTAAVFAGFVAQVLVPRLRPGDFVVWDHARIHSAAAVRLVEEAGAAVLLQPRYSPEFNAAELFWSKVKAFVGRARADTAEALEAAVVAAAATVTREDVVGWMRHCGYSCQPAC